MVRTRSGRSRCGRVMMAEGFKRAGVLSVEQVPIAIDGTSGR